MSEQMPDNGIRIETTKEYLRIKPVTVRNWIKKVNLILTYQIGKLRKFASTEPDAWGKSGRAGEI